MESEDENHEIQKIFNSPSAHSDIEKTGINNQFVDDNGNTFLICASHLGRLDIVQFLLNNGADTEIKNTFGNTALISASSQQDSFEIVKWLIDKGANTKIKNKYGETSLIVAAGVGETKTVELLLPISDVNVKNIYGETALSAASFVGHIEVVRSLLKVPGLNINETNDENQTALFSAVEGGHLDIIKLLIDHEADTNITDKYGRLPIHSAVRCGITSYDNLTPKKIKNYLEITKILLRNLKDINVKDYKGNTLLIASVGSGVIDIIKHLLGLPYIDINAKNNQGYSALSDAVSVINIDVVKLLLQQNNIDINTVTNDNRSCLHFAIEMGNIDILELLLSNHIDIKIVTDINETPLHFAAKYYMNDMIKYLLDKRIYDVDDVNSPNLYGETALHLSASIGDIPSVKIFLNSRAQIDARNMSGETPLFLAVKYNYIDTVKVLIENGAQLNISNRDGDSLITVAFHINNELFNLLLDRGADVTKLVKSMTPPNLRPDIIVRTGKNNGRIIEEIIDTVKNPLPVKGIPVTVYRQYHYASRYFNRDTIYSQLTIMFYMMRDIIKAYETSELLPSTETYNLCIFLEGKYRKYDYEQSKNKPKLTPEKEINIFLNDPKWVFGVCEIPSDYICNYFLERLDTVKIALFGEYGDKKADKARESINSGTTTENKIMKKFIYLFPSFSLLFLMWWIDKTIPTKSKLEINFLEETTEVRYTYYEYWNKNFEDMLGKPINETKYTDIIYYMYNDNTSSLYDNVRHTFNKYFNKNYTDKEWEENKIGDKILHLARTHPTFSEREVSALHLTNNCLRSNPNSRGIIIFGANHNFMRYAPFFSSLDITEVGSIMTTLSKSDSRVMPETDNVFEPKKILQDLIRPEHIYSEINGFFPRKTYSGDPNKIEDVQDNILVQSFLLFKESSLINRRDIFNNKCLNTMVLYLRQFPKKGKDPKWLYDRLSHEPDIEKQQILTQLIHSTVAATKNLDNFGSGEILSRRNSVPIIRDSIVLTDKQTYLDKTNASILLSSILKIDKYISDDKKLKLCRDAFLEYFKSSGYRDTRWLFEMKNQTDDEKSLLSVAKEAFNKLQSDELKDLTNIILSNYEKYSGEKNTEKKLALKELTGNSVRKFVEQFPDTQSSTIFSILMFHGVKAKVFIQDILDSIYV